MESKYKLDVLKNYIEQIRGVSYKKTDVSNCLQEAYLPILRANNIQDNKIYFDDLVYVKKEKVKKDQLIKKGDILIAASSGSKSIVGKAGQVEEDVECSFGAFCKIIRCNNFIDNKYLGFYFKSNYYRQTISHLSAGANINNIRNEHIENLIIPLPPLETQKKIAEVLDNAGELIDKRKEQIEKLDEFIESVFLNMFGDPGTNPKGWGEGTIRNLVSEVRYGTSKKADEKQGKYPILRMGNITYRGNWNFDDLKYIDLEESELDKYLVQKGDILFNRTNSKELVGKSAVYKEDAPMAYAGYLIRVRTNEKAVPEYIWGHLNSRYGKLILENMCKNIVGMANINAQELQDIKIPIPPIHLQNQFAEIVEEVEKQKAKMEASLTEMENLFNSLMQKAFKGELF